MRNPKSAVCMIAAALLATTVAHAQSEKPAGQGKAVVTVLSRHSGDKARTLSAQDLRIKVNGRESNVTGWVPLADGGSNLELVILIDSASSRDLSTQFDEIRHFVLGLSPQTKVAIAYMENGRTLLASPLSADHALVLKGLHISRAPSASAYFCLSDLAKHWPSSERSARREVLLITDGIEPYLGLEYDPDDSYVQAAINDSVRANLVVYSIFWSNQRNSSSSTSEIWSSGQNYLQSVAQATGGKNYWIGLGNPVSFQSYFEDLSNRFQNQYELRFTAKLDGKATIASLKLKVGGEALNVDAPAQTLVDHAGIAE